MKWSTFAFGAGVLLTSAMVHAGGGSGVLLDANFNDHPLDQQIGTGGPELGEPVSMDPDLSAIVRAGPRPNPSLEFSHAALGLARAARFNFLGDEEVSHGDLVIRLIIHASQLDFYPIYVREPDTNAQSFMSMLLDPAGHISVSDATGSAGIIGSYLANTDHQVDFLFHMDAGTYDIALDEVPVLIGRPHGVTERGIGALLLGTSHQTAIDSLFYVDRIRVLRGDGIFSDGFE